MSIKSRIEKLEAMSGVDAEVTLEELVRYSYVYPTVRDLDFERRLARSRIAKVFMASIRTTVTDASGGDV